MPAIHHTITVKAPLEVVWQHVQSVGNWAGLVPGYQGHEELNERDSVWTLFVDVGPFTRMMELEVQVTERIEPWRVAFALKSCTEPVSGSGMFRALSEAGGNTSITLDLIVDGTGPLAAVIGRMAGPVLSHMTRTFARRLVSQIEQRASSNNVDPNDSVR